MSVFTQDGRSPAHPRHLPVAHQTTWGNARSFQYESTPVLNNAFARRSSYPFDLSVDTLEADIQDLASRYTTNDESQPILNYAANLVRFIISIF